MNNTHHNTIFDEQATILSQQKFDGNQFILRVQAPLCAANALPGSFAHVQCGPELLLRRPLSIMNADADAGWVDILYKIVGKGTCLLSQRRVGEKLAWLGPIGKGFDLHPDRPLRLLIGGGVGLPPMVFLSHWLQQQQTAATSFVIMGSEVPFPFKLQTSSLAFAGTSDDINASMPLLNEWKISNRLCSLQGFPGCHQGFVTDLAKLWLDTLDPTELQQVEIFSCGPTAMLKAVSQIAKNYAVACQVSLEEYMACAVGGCAGCVVKVKTDSGTAMKRVCVDGPVFSTDQLIDF